LTGSLEKISSGLRIRRSADDSAGLAVSSRMNADNVSLRQAMRNTNDGVSLVQTAEGTLNEISTILTRMRELSVQASNGTYSTSDRQLIDKEFVLMKNEIRRIASNATYNGISLLAGKTGAITLQVGIDNVGGDKLGIKMSTIAASQGALSISTLSVGSTASALGAIASIDAAINTVNTARAELGATQNRLESALSQATTYSENLAASYSQIMDLDYASESATMTRYQIMQQAGVAALGQAKAIPQSVLSLLG
ncbi:MAG: flagellin, partial [Myxococcota bacterium]|nr:flagellin [Myxococcota bacterium]